MLPLPLLDLWSSWEDRRCKERIAKLANRCSLELRLHVLGELRDKRDAVLGAVLCSEQGRWSMQRVTEVLGEAEHAQTPRSILTERWLG